MENVESKNQEQIKTTDSISLQKENVQEQPEIKESLNETEDKNIKRKESNGFLRKNNHKKNNNSHSKQFKKPQKPYQKHNNPYKQYDDSNVDTTPTVIPEEKQILYSLSSKINFSNDKFILTLNELLKKHSFSDIKENDMDLLNYSLLYSKEEVFKYLLDNFKEYITEESIQKNILNYSFNKNSFFIKELLSFYDNNYNAQEDFINKFISQACKTSYRFDNNNLILSWFSEHLNDEKKKLFWSECIKERNVVLFEHALVFDNLKSFLKSNYNDFKDNIKLFGKQHTVEKAFSEKSKGNILNSEPEEISNNPTLLKNKINEDFLPKTKESTQPEIIVKKKRSININ